MIMRQRKMRYNKGMQRTVKPLRALSAADAKR